MKALGLRGESSNPEFALARTRLTVEPATEAHGALLAAHIRPEDAAEMMASHGLGPVEGVKLALRVSPDAKAILDGKKVVAIFGTAPVDAMEGVASIWLLATKLVKRLPVAFMRVAKREFRRIAASKSVLANAVLATNETALRLVECLGFQVLEPTPLGATGQLFRPILFRRST